MSSFSAGWLALREPFDVMARDRQYATSLQTRWFRKRPRRILDLATGTGANLRYLAPRLGGDQQWLLVDRDACLLAALPQRIASWAAANGYIFTADSDTSTLAGNDFSARIRSVQLDLAAELDHLPLDEIDLVTASALLDLVSNDWLVRLADACHEAESGAFFALNYDGRIQWTPPDSDDELLRTLLNRHQLTDKGFGAALGPRAVGVTRALFAARNYLVEETPTDWRISGSDHAIQSRLIDDWSAVAAGTAPSRATCIGAWRSRRLAHLARGVSRLTVGHVDLLAFPDAACRR